MENNKEKIIRLRTYAIGICDVFEDLLDEHDITIPDDDRTGDENEARIYGATYYDTEDAIVDILERLVKKIKANPDAVIYTGLS